MKRCDEMCELMRQAVISDILLAIEVYMVPCIYSAMVAARDEVRTNGWWLRGAKR